MLERARAEGWVEPRFGDLAAARLRDGRIVLTLRPPAGDAPVEIEGECLSDCTGLVADATASPFLKDLTETYRLPRNRQIGADGVEQLAGLVVTNQFEVKALRNGAGRVYAAGIVAAGGPQAAADSFLGLSDAALRSLDHLAEARAPGVGRLGPAQSVRQWWRWMRGIAP